MNGVVTRPEILALLDEDAQPSVVAHRYFFVPAPSRDGTNSSRAQIGAVFLPEPIAAVLFPSDLHELSPRRPDIADPRRVLVKFSFRLDRLPPRQAYKSATLTVRLDHPDAVMRAQVPALVTPDSESTDILSTELSVAVNGAVKGAAHQCSDYHRGQLPVITAEKRTRSDFSWRYEPREGMPLPSRNQDVMAVIELPGDVTELTGHLDAEAVIEVPRWGVPTADRTLPMDPRVPFRLALDSAA